VISRFALALLTAVLFTPAIGAQPATALEQGKFRLHKFEQPIGEETYQITRDGNSLDVKMDFKFTDRGQDVPLSATFRGATDLTPQTFEIHGKTSRISTIDESIEVRPSNLRIRNGDRVTEAARPPQFFTIAGYAPATLQMLMVRYWSAHGSPENLPAPPDRRIHIESRGLDTISLEGKSYSFSRYTVQGLIWGRETLWFNPHNDLIAAVTTDAEFDHFEAVREGFEGALAQFVAQAGADGMAAMLELSRGVTGVRSSAMAFVGATVVDGTGSPALSDMTVVVRGRRIVTFGKRSEVSVPKDAKEIVATGKTILPGLWDMHAHFEQVEWGPIYLAAGATTVRDCGNELEFITAVRDAIANGRGLGPRILAAGVVDGSGPDSLGVERVDTPEQAHDWVDRYHQAGFQQMKIYSSTKLDQVRAVAEEAHKLGMTVTGHVPIGLTGYDVVEAGQDQINHIDYVLSMMQAPLPQEARRIDRMKATAEIELNSEMARKAVEFLRSHHTVIDPTLSIFELETASAARPVASFEPGVDKVAPELAQQFLNVAPAGGDADLAQKIFAKALAAVGALHRAGVTIIAGTDQAVPGHSLHREIELYVQAGFTPMDAIQAATIVPAQVMGLDKETGTVEVGKRADLVVLDGNPLDDIHNIRRIRYVVANGKLYEAATLWHSVGFKP
jgi:imidazolonepropionase-like amidohydrolase